jgi:hypothetical protein
MPTIVILTQKLREGVFPTMGIDRVRFVRHSDEFGRNAYWVARTPILSAFIRTNGHIFSERRTTLATQLLSSSLRSSYLE